MSFRSLGRRAAWSVFLLLVRAIYRLRIQGASRESAGGPMVFIGNHGSALDPLWVVAVARRQVRFMASEGLFRGRFSGPFVRLFGAFPKRKFEPDVRAVRQLVHLCRQGHAVCFFPEGGRTWDGRTLPLVAGAGGVVKLLDAPVTFVRNRTSYLCTPPWARYARWVPIRLEVSGPVRFGADESEEQIEAEIVRRITVDPLSNRAPRFSLGWRMAEGLPDLLWACPQCFAVDALRAAGLLRNDLRCGSCGAWWRLRIDFRLQARNGAAPDLHLATACDRITAHFSGRPMAAPGPAYGDGIVLVHAQARVLQRSERGPELVGSGCLQLTVNELRLCDGPGKPLWIQPLAGIHAAFIEAGYVLVRGGERLSYLDVGGARNKWGHFIACHAGHATPERSGRARR